MPSKPLLSCTFSYSLFQIPTKIKPIVFTIQCPLGFGFDNEINKCKLIWAIAGRANKSQKLTVLCPKNHNFDETSKTCVMGVVTEASITVPTVCDFGFKLDPNGNCREVWWF